MKISYILISLISIIIGGCGLKVDGNARTNLEILAEGESVGAGDILTDAPIVNFDADSAYSYIAGQVEFGPRVPNTEAHIRCGEWLAAELRRHGALVKVQDADLKAFDGTILKSKNIFGQINPEAKDRILFLAHWDTRPWADKDPDESKRTMPVDGANDGASGVGVLLEIARQLKNFKTDKGIDILFVDAEDWGTDGDEDSWALGAKYFVENPIIPGYSPRHAILLDMVGGKDAVFCREYFSERSAPGISQQLWDIAARNGYGKIFLNKMGSAILDDHVQLIKAGIPAIDIIEYHPEDENGFNHRWHTVADNMEGISKETLSAVGTTVMNYIANLK